MSLITRRDVLAGGLRAAGCLALGPAVRRPQEAKPPPPAAPVAIQRCGSYEPRLLRERLDRALDLIGGIGDLVRGKTVTVKLNLTGKIQMTCGKPAHRTFHTHPGITAALCAALADAGASKIVLVESFYYRQEPEIFLKNGGWDVESILSAGAQKVVIENTRNRGPWPSYSRLKVPGEGYLFPAFDVNARYEKTDVFISLAKMKENKSTRITLGAKNLIGVLPQSLYGVGAPDEENLRARGWSVHDGSRRTPEGVPPDNGFLPPEGEPAWKWRVPRATADITRARPIDLVVIDGIETVAAAEGPWHRDIRAIEPGLILAGRNVVCTDAVGSAVMGFDPEAPHMKDPFPGENHLQLLAEAGVGTHDLDRIEVRGLSIKEALCPFQKT